ncbi:MAG: L-2-amino-thiazoline-4-carboxylic acid hydrolase [Promethearchaeota archaeon]|nr:MAG: L-2-amino-thiazoline-4-carboxylic acid hydrolase [Candidatus Lokiarchaeota archaeon]
MQFKIPNETTGFTNEDLMDTLKEMGEVGNKYKIDLFNFFARLFCTLSEEIISKFGESGKEAIISGVKKFGEKRGNEIAEIVKSLGKELTLKNYFIYTTFDAGETTKYKVNIVDGNVELKITKCVFCDGCKDWDKLKYGRIYCDYIDEAILKDYNPNLKIEVPYMLTRGDKHCVQRYIRKA